MRASLFILAVLAVGCSQDTNPFGPDRFVTHPLPFTAPDTWRDWFAEAEKCAGLERSFDVINWVWAAEIVWNGKQVAGLWRRPNTIYLVAGKERYRALVKHEALHYLLQAGGHPEPPFGVCDKSQPGVG